MMPRLILALILVFGLAACGQDSPEGSKDPNTEGSMLEDMRETADGTMDAAREAAHDLSERAEKVAEKAGEMAEDAGEAIADTAEDAIKKTQQTMGRAADAIDHSDAEDASQH